MGIFCAKKRLCKEYVELSAELGLKLPRGFLSHHLNELLEARNHLVYIFQFSALDRTKTNKYHLMKPSEISLEDIKRADGDLAIGKIIHHL